MWFDLFLVGMVFGGVVLGVWKGLAWQLAGIFSIFLGFALGRPISAAIAGLYENPSVFTRFLIFAITYAAISLGCYLLALLWRRKLKEFRLQRYDRHLGGFLGAIHGLAWCAIFTMFIIVFREDTRKPILSRPTGKLVAHTLDGLHGIMPDGLHDILHPYMHPEEEESAPVDDHHDHEHP